MRLSAQARDLIAAEYVLGTLSGKARDRFENMLHYDADLRYLVDEWSDRLGVMGGNITPISPPPRVWRSLASRLGLAQDPQNIQASATTGISDWWRSLVLWRSTSLLTTLAVIAMAVYIGLFPIQSPPPVPSYVAVLNNQGAQSAWVIKAEPQQRLLSIQSVTPQQLADKKSFELWILPANNQPPHSLGLVSNRGATKFTLSVNAAELLLAAQGLAISLEPMGGSPSGLPTGPILYQGKLQQL